MKETVKRNRPINYPIRIIFRCTKEQKKKIDKICKRSGKTVTDLIRNYVENL